MIEPVQVVENCDLKELKKLAQSWLTYWQPGIWIRLVGDLGAGKTTFVRETLHALGWEDEVPSPSYPLMIEYEWAGRHIIHIDGFRLSGSDPWDFKEWPKAVVFVEWAERTQLPSTRFDYEIRFSISPKNESQRKVELFQFSR